MKRLILIAAITLVSCHKRLVSPPPGDGFAYKDSLVYGEWTLSYSAVQGFWHIWTFAPRDSVVRLGLGPNGSYYTKLNGKMVDSGTYNLTTTLYPSAIDTNYALHNFATTGRFTLDSGLLFYAGDTLYLQSTLITPEGLFYYAFYR